VGLAILANSRPYEGLLVSIPVAIVLLTWLTSRKGPGIAISIKYVVLPILIVCVLSGIAMGYYNFRVTGSPLRMPYQVYEAKYAMTPVFLWQRPRPAPIYHHQVFRDLDQNVSLEWYTMEHSIIGFTVKNLTYFFWAILYFWDVFGIPLIGMAPLMVRWAFRNRWALFALATCGVLTIGLVSQTYLAIHYLAPITCFNSVFVVQAIRLWRWRNRKVGQVVLWLLPLLALASLLWSLHWAIKKDNPSIWFRQRARILEQLQRQNEKHLIVVSYGPQHSFNDEWVYNEADIDNAKVVWARSMNTRENCQLVNFFKDRRIWSLEVNNDNSIIEPMPYPVNQCR